MEQRSDEWFNARLGIVTASSVKLIMGKDAKGKPLASRKNYMMKLLCERLTGKSEEFYTTKEMQRGIDLEPLARCAFEIETGFSVNEVGLILHKSISGFGASPDGILSCSKKGIEIKCPNTAKHVAMIQSETHDSDYEWQMLAQMACAELEGVYFISFDDRLPESLQLRHCYYPRDEKRIELMEKEVLTFNQELDSIESEMRKKMQ